MGTLSPPAQTAAEASRTAQIDKSLKSYNRRRNLILTLVANEIERLCTWSNPRAVVDKQLAGETVVAQWRQSSRGDVRAEVRMLRDSIKYAWSFSPSLAVHLYYRFKSLDECRAELARFVRAEPAAVRHIPEALPLLLEQSALEADAAELAHVLTWAERAPAHALALLTPRQMPMHPLTAQYAVKVLKKCPPDTLLFYIPQLVQAMRHDTVGDRNDECDNTAPHFSSATSASSFCGRPGTANCWRINSCGT